MARQECQKANSFERPGALPRAHGRQRIEANVPCGADHVRARLLQERGLRVCEKVSEARKAVRVLRYGRL